MPVPEHQQQPDIATSNDTVAMNETPQGSPFDVVALLQEARRDSRITEVDRGMDMIRSGSLERFGKYISNNPDVEEKMRRELKEYGIELDVTRFPGTKKQAEVVLSTPIEGTNAIRRGLTIRASGVTPEIVERADKYSVENALLDFKMSKQPYNLEAFKAELYKRIPPRPGPTGMVG